MTPPPISETQLRRYLERTGSLDDIASVEAWLRSEPLAKALVGHLQDTPVSSDAVDAVWARVAGAMDQAPSVGPSRGAETFGASRARRATPSSTSVWRRTWPAVAIAAAAAVAIIAYRPTSHNARDVHTYATTAREQKAIMLSDGTRATLAPRTSLRVVRLDASGRDVVLDSGEVYFTVSNASGVPFIVHGGSVTTRVLGTEFLVRRDIHRAQMHVSVTRGKVSVAAKQSRATTLTAGESVLADSVVHVSSVSDGVAGAEWTPDRLLFRHTPVSVVLGALAKWYGYQFHCADSSMAHRYVTIAVSTQSSSDALEAIERVLEVNVTVRGDTVTLASPRVTQPRSTPRTRVYDVWTPTREVGR